MREFIAKITEKIDIKMQSLKYKGPLHCTVTYNWFKFFLKNIPIIIENIYRKVASTNACY